VPEQSLATLHVRRESDRSRDRFRAYRVIVDGEQVGQLRVGESRQLQIEPGTHFLRISIDRSGSGEIEIRLVPAQVAAFVCGPAGTPLKGLWQVFTRHRYLRLAPDLEAPAGERS